MQRNLRPNLVKKAKFSVISEPTQFITHKVSV